MNLQFPSLAEPAPSSAYIFVSSFLPAKHRLGKPYTDKASLSNPALPDTNHTQYKTDRAFPTSPPKLWRLPFNLTGQLGLYAERRLGASLHTCIRSPRRLSLPTADSPDSAAPAPPSCLPNLPSLAIRSFTDRSIHVQLVRVLSSHIFFQRQGINQEPQTIKAKAEHTLAHNGLGPSFHH